MSSDIPASTLLFSVVIPTFNRAGLLAGAVESLLQQAFDPLAFEIIVVDNGSSNETREMVEKLRAGSTKHTLHYLFVPEPGGGIARRAGAASARGEWVAYMDDDARASPGWLQTAAEVLRERRDLSGMGGPIHPFYLADRPAWFQDEYEIRTWGDAPRYLTRDEAFAGANMLFPRELLKKLGEAMPGFGMVGNMMHFGEDTILFEQAWKLLGQAKFYYHPGLLMYHAVPARNMDTGYILRRQFSIGASNFRRTGPRAFFRRVLFILRHAGSLLRLATCMVLRRGKFARRENWLVEYGGPVAKKIGLLSAALGLNIRFRQRQEDAP